MSKDESKKSASIKKEREVNTYAYMWSASHHLLDVGVKEKSGCFYQFLGSLVFAAFTLEAYLNHIGPQVFKKKWKDLESLSPKGKLIVISEQLGIVPDYGEKPWQVMKDLFDFRNQVAHGKSMVVKDEVTIPAHKYKGDEHRGFVPIKWEKLCTEENVIRAREDVELIVKILHEAGGFEPSRYDFAMGGQGYSVTSNDNIE